MDALQPFLPAILVAVPVILIVFVVVRVLGRRRGDADAGELEKLDTYVESDWTPGPTDTASEDATSTRVQVAAQLDNLLARRGFAGSVRSQLRKADLKLTVSEYLILHVVLAAAFGAAGTIFRGPVFGGIGVIAGFFAPRIFVASRQKRRLNAFNDQLADILNLWVNSLRAGFSVPQAMEAVAKEAPPPACDEFKRVVAETAIGIPMETALNNMLSRIESEDLDLVFTAVNIQREVGGNLAEILDTISHTIRERVRIKGEIRTLTSSGRATGAIIGLLPLGLGLLLYVINPGYMGQLLFGPPVGAYFSDTIPIPCGWPIMAIGLIMMGIGMAIINRIVDIEI